MYVANHIWINIISRNMLNWLIQMANKNLFVISVAQVMLHCKLSGYILEKNILSIQACVYYLRTFRDLKFPEKSKLQVILPLAD